MRGGKEEEKQFVCLATFNHHSLYDEQNHFPNEKHGTRIENCHGRVDESNLKMQKDVKRSKKQKKRE